MKFNLSTSNSEKKLYCNQGGKSKCFCDVCSPENDDSDWFESFEF